MDTINLNLFLKEAERTTVNSTTSPCGNYILFKYSKTISYEENWTETSLQSRGIVFDLRNGECVAFPYEKFFNLNELSESLETRFRKEGLERFTSRWDWSEIEGSHVLDKLDGSLVIIWLDNEGKLRSNTPGSFESEQAVFALEWIKNNSLSERILKEFWKNGGEYHTLLGEFIHPSSKMVVKYPASMNGIHLHSARKKDFSWASKEELGFISERTGLDLVKFFNSPVQLLLEEGKSRAGTEMEGWVFWDSSGRRIKIKTAEYCSLHRIISHTHPNRVIDISNSLESKITFPVDKLPEFFQRVDKWISEIEEEDRPDFQKFVDEIHKELEVVQRAKDFAKTTKLSKREIAAIQELSKEEKAIVFTILDNKELRVPLRRLIDAAKRKTFGKE